MARCFPACPEGLATTWLPPSPGTSWPRAVRSWSNASTRCHSPAACGRRPPQPWTAGFLAVELTCSDAAEHRRRARQRVSDIEGLKLPDWQEITRRDYAPWPEADLRLDTARLTTTEAARTIICHGLTGGAR